MSFASPHGASQPHPSNTRETTHSHTDRFRPDDFFGEQPSCSHELPDPEPLLVNLTRSVIEVIAGARELSQLARWITEDVHGILVKRVILAERARRVKGLPTVRPIIQVGSVTISEPRDGIIEAVVLVHGKARSRAVAIRLEGLDHRWRATSISVL